MLRKAKEKKMGHIKVRRNQDVCPSSRGRVPGYRHSQHDHRLMLTELNLVQGYACLFGISDWVDIGHHNDYDVLWS